MSNQEIRRKALDLYTEVMQEKLESGNVALFDMAFLATQCIEAYKQFNEVAQEVLGPAIEDCHLNE